MRELEESLAVGKDGLFFLLVHIDVSLEIPYDELHSVAYVVEIQAEMLQQVLLNEAVVEDRGVRELILGGLVCFI